MQMAQIPTVTDLSPDDLKRLRLAAGLSQEEFAKRIGTSQSNVARWEGGSIKPGLRHAVSIARFISNGGAVFDRDASREEMRSDFAIRLHSVRTARGISMREVGGLVGVSAQAVSQWEAGTTHPRPEVAQFLENWMRSDEALAAGPAANDKQMGLPIGSLADRLADERTGILGRLSRLKAESELAQQELVAIDAALASLSRATASQPEHA